LSGEEASVAVLVTATLNEEKKGGDLDEATEHRRKEKKANRQEAPPLADERVKSKAGVDPAFVLLVGVDAVQGVPFANFFYWGQPPCLSMRSIQEIVCRCGHLHSITTYAPRIFQCGCNDARNEQLHKKSDCFIHSF
jgi:hypothetical protein